MYQVPHTLARRSNHLFDSSLLSLQALAKKLVRIRAGTSGDTVCASSLARATTLSIFRGGGAGWTICNSCKTNAFVRNASANAADVATFLADFTSGLVLFLHILHNIIRHGSLPLC